MPRKKGFKHTQETKDKIANSMRDKKLSEETKDKIADSVLKHYREANPLSEEIINQYCRMDDDVMCDWIMSVAEELDNDESLLTESGLRGKWWSDYYHFWCLETDNIETPESLLIKKIECLNEQPEKQTVESFVALGGTITCLPKKEK